MSDGNGTTVVSLRLPDKATRSLCDAASDAGRTTGEQVRALLGPVIAGAAGAVSDGPKTYAKVCVTDDEAAAIATGAREAGVSASALVRDRCCGNGCVRDVDLDGLAAASHDVVEAGQGLNDVAHRLNAAGPEKVASVAVRLEAGMRAALAGCASALSEVHSILFDGNGRRP